MFGRRTGPLSAIATALVNLEIVEDDTLPIAADTDLTNRMVRVDRIDQQLLIQPRSDMIAPETQLDMMPGVRQGLDGPFRKHAIALLEEGRDETPLAIRIDFQCIS
jgi:hypothetical protein